MKKQYMGIVLWGIFWSATLNTFERKQGQDSASDQLKKLQQEDAVLFEIRLEALRAMFQEASRNKLSASKDNKKIESFTKKLEELEKQLEQEDYKGVRADKAKIKQYKTQIEQIKIEMQQVMPQGYISIDDALVKKTFNEQLNAFMSMYRAVGGSYSLFDDFTQQSREFTDAFKRIEDMINIIAEGKLDDQSRSIGYALSAFFSTMESIRAEMKNRVTNPDTWLNRPRASQVRVQLKTQFQTVDKKAIDGYVNDLKMAQKKMNSKFGFFSSPILKSEYYKMAYNGLKTIAKAVSEMIDSLDKVGVYKSFKELSDLMKK